MKNRGNIDHDWIQMKRAEVWKAYQHFGEIIKGWDLVTFLRIIDEQQRLIRKLQTQLNAKKGD